MMVCRYSTSAMVTAGTYNTIIVRGLQEQGGYTREAEDEVLYVGG